MAGVMVRIDTDLIDHAVKKLEEHLKVKKVTKQLAVEFYLRRGIETNTSSGDR